MLRIGVCNSNGKNKEYLEGMIAKWGVECRIYWFEKEEEISQNASEMDIWILDIEKVEESGLQYVLKGAAEKQTVKKEPSIVIKSGTVYHNVPVREIIFAENNGRKIILHLEEKQLEFYGKMEDLEQELGEGFFRCHRGFLVAMDKITGYDAGNIYLKNGENVYLAKRKYSEFSKKYMKYIENRKKM